MPAGLWKSVLLAALIIVLTGAGGVSLRWQARELYGSTTRMDRPTEGVRALMGERPNQERVRLEDMARMDHYWFALHHQNQQAIEAFAAQMLEDNIAATAIACLSTDMDYELHAADSSDVVVCSVGEDSPIPPCAPNTLLGQEQRTVLIAFMGGNPGLSRKDLIRSCIRSAEHRHRWQDRR